MFYDKNIMTRHGQSFDTADSAKGPIKCFKLSIFQPELHLV